MREICTSESHEPHVEAQKRLIFVHERAGLEELERILKGCRGSLSRRALSAAMALAIVRPFAVKICTEAVQETTMTFDRSSR
jgi:hypothetical protein